MSIFACLIPSVVSPDGLFVSGETWKDKKKQVIFLLIFIVYFYKFNSSLFLTHL